MVSRWEGTAVRFESWPPLRNRRLLADEGGGGRRGTRDSLRRNYLESTTKFLSRRQAHYLCVLRRPGLAPAVGDARSGWRSGSSFLWRFRQHQSALVAGWREDRLHFESRREHRLVDPASAQWLPARARDRKSTRLNSSHVSISYAV